MMKKVAILKLSVLAALILFAVLLSCDGSQNIEQIKPKLEENPDFVVLREMKVNFEIIYVICDKPTGNLLYLSVEDGLQMEVNGCE